MLIREAELADAPQLAQLHIKAWQIAYAGDMPDDYLLALNTEDRTRDWEAWIKVPSAKTTIVIERNRAVTGFCVFGPFQEVRSRDRKIGEIIALNVHPEFWRCGYGRALCNTTFSKAKERQWNSLLLWTLKSNERAKAFYLSLGFRRDAMERQVAVTDTFSVQEEKYSINIPV